MTILKNINNLYNKNKKNVKKSSSVKTFLLKVGNNRILDLYLKYLGITVLNTNTLIPLAFILGAKTFDKVVIIDYKSGSYSVDDEKQVVDYAKTLSLMGYKNIEKMLIYTSENINIVNL